MQTGMLTALPLAIAMRFNAHFVPGLVFVHGHWDVVEYLFPLSLMGFAAVAVGFQLAVIVLVLMLNRRPFGAHPTATAIAAARKSHERTMRRRYLWAARWAPP